jgi:hypothetical protein
VPPYQVKSPAQVEEELDRELEHLEALTNGGWSPKAQGDLQGFDTVAETAANAEADWKIEQARAKVVLADRDAGGRKEAEHLMDARILSAKADLYRAYKVTGAVKDSHLEALRTARAQVDAARTKCANRRGEGTGGQS